MPTRLTTVFLCLLTATLVWTGCSDGTVRGSLEPSPYLSVPVARYFPIAEGYTTQLSVTYADGGTAIHSYEIGSPQMYDYFTAYPLRVYSKRQLLTTSFVVVADSALFIFENGGTSPAKILSLPLYAGRSWDRSDETELSGLDNNPDQDDADDNSDDGGQTEDGDAGPQDGPQFFPSSNGQQTMTVLGRETVYLDDGQAFAGSYRIRNDNLDGGSNYFWYAPGIGLVRYVLNADPNDIGQGSEVGELINFGINLRR